MLKKGFVCLLTILAICGGVVVAPRTAHAQSQICRIAPIYRVAQGPIVLNRGPMLPAIAVMVPVGAEVIHINTIEIAPGPVMRQFRFDGIDGWTGNRTAFMRTGRVVTVCD